MNKNKKTMTGLIIALLIISSMIAIADTTTYTDRGLQAKNYQHKYTMFSGKIKDTTISWSWRTPKTPVEVSVYCRHNGTEYLMGTTTTGNDGKFSLKNKTGELCVRSDYAWITIGDFKSKEVKVTRHTNTPAPQAPPAPVVPVVLTCEDKQTQCLNNAEKDYSNAVDACNEKTDGAKTMCLMTAVFNYNQDKASCGVEKQKCDCSEKEGFVWFFGRCVKDRR